MPRQGHTATLLRDGKVLVAGGSGDGDDQTSAQVYDPSTGKWTAAGGMAEARQSHTATLLPDGTVLVAGGSGLLGQLLASAELYHPGTGSWTATGDMDEGRGLHTATLLPDGKVLVTGGATDPDGENVLASAELYDPGSRSWTATGAMSRAHSGHTATLLPDGKVLVAGGVGGFVNPTDPRARASAELYDPGSGRWTATASMSEARFGHTSTLLPDGKVLVAGGSAGFGVLLASAQLYDPARRSWTATKGMIEAHAGRTATATLLSDGKVLVAGGFGKNDGLASPELYDPSSGRWTATARMVVGRDDFSATLLRDGKVLVAGGMDAQTSAELYEPGRGSG